MSWAAAWLFVKNAGSWLVSNWREVLLVAVAGLILYQHFEVSHYRDEVAGYATATKQAQAQQAQQAADSLAFVKKGNQTYANLISFLTSQWAPAIVSVRNTGGGQTGQSISVPTGFCATPNAEQRLSDALAKYERGIGAAVAGYQAGVGQLLEDASRKQAERDSCNGYVTGESLIHSK